MQRRKVRPSLIAGAVIGLAALLLLGALLLRHQKPGTSSTFARAGAPGRHRLGLNVEREGQVLLVAWDRRSPAMHKASHAILYIKDGPQQSQVDLNHQQLIAANVQYWPETPKVTFMLEVYQGDGSISDSVQVAGVDSSATATKPKPDAATRGLAVNTSKEPERPSPFAPRTQREVKPDPSIRLATRLATPAQPRLIVSDAPTPPPVVERSRLARVVDKIPLLRRLTKHPQHPDNEDPPR